MLLPELRLSISSLPLPPPHHKGWAGSPSVEHWSGHWPAHSYWPHPQSYGCGAQPYGYMQPQVPSSASYQQHATGSYETSTSADQTPPPPRLDATPPPPAMSEVKRHPIHQPRIQQYSNEAGHTTDLTYTHSHTLNHAHAMEAVGRSENQPQVLKEMSNTHMEVGVAPSSGAPSLSGPEKVVGPPLGRGGEGRGGGGRGGGGGGGGGGIVAGRQHVPSAQSSGLPGREPWLQSRVPPCPPSRGRGGLSGPRNRKRQSRWEQPQG